MIPLKQSTATTFKAGPFVDSTDGDTPETTLTIQKADVKLSKNAGAMANASADQGAADAGAPHDALGEYTCSLDATDSNTLGRLEITIRKTGALIWKGIFEVVPADVFDALVSGTGAGIRSSLLSIGGNSAQNQAAATNLNDAARGLVRFTVGGGSSVTNVVTSSLDPAPTVTDQLKNSTMVFARDTTTAALRGQRRAVTGSGTGVSAALTIDPLDPLTTTPASGDYGTLV